jgi:signal transduction histidine kinase
MHRGLNRTRQASVPVKTTFLFATILVLNAAAQNSDRLNSVEDPAPITNLLQMTESVNRNGRVIRNIDLEAAVCAASDTSIGVAILQDASGVELVELDSEQSPLFAGEKIRLRGANCLLRRRDLGVEISGAPVVDNDGVHVRRTAHGEISLKRGRHPLQLDWFNQFRDFSLEATWQATNDQPQAMSGDLLSRMEGSNYLPGLRVESYEGNWESTPDFELLRPTKDGVATNFNLQLRMQDEMVGLRFTGFFDAPQDGTYVFRTSSDDGSLLFIENLRATVTPLGTIDVPVPAGAVIGEAMANPEERRWISVEGRVTFARKVGKGVEFELSSERDSMRVRIADAAPVNPAALLHSHVRVTGVGRGVFNLDRRIVLGQLFAASEKQLDFLDGGSGTALSRSPLTRAQQVQTLPLEEARRSLPVKIRGVVTSKGAPYDFWLSIQDDTRGIFVDIHALSNALPVCGESWEITGHSGAGDFAPIVVADRGTRLGIGRLPEPARPGWNELINGSMDVQWVEFQGLVTDVQSNQLSLLLTGGELDVQMQDRYEAELKQFEKAVVRIRGVLYANWKTGTRELSVGSIRLRNASINVDMPAPRDPFDAVVKTPRDLLLFDAQATAFHRVKVLGQVIHAEAGRVFLMDSGAGIRVLPATATKLNAGDLVEAAGYPEISDTSLILREAILRKTGEAPLPPAKALTDATLTHEGTDSTRVHVEGKLLGSHFEYGARVLEMQSGTHLYLARIPASAEDVSMRIGSRLGLNGVYAGQKRTRLGVEAESFELLLNSPADITVLSQPSWWTLQRLLVLVGVLLIVLMFSVVWIRQLRRLVEQRTAQLHREIRERERVERARALEAERSRIARDLHDDLGSSLTEIGVLASSAQRLPADTNNYPSLFRTIAGKARSLIAALDVIVWAVDPEDNSLQSVADYLSGFVREYLSRSDIACRFKVPVSFPEVMLNGQVRHDLLLAVKETLNNIVRHSEATEVGFGMSMGGGELEILITDNGKGFEAATVRDGHGLKNLVARLETIGGIYSVESRVGAGTTVRVHLPLPVAEENSSMNSRIGA